MRIQAVPLLALCSAAAVPAAAAGDDPSLFAGSIYQSLAAIIAFVLLLVILRKFAWGPILSGLQDREQKIRDDLKRAEDAAGEATATMEQYKQQLADAQRKAQEVIEASRTQAQQVAAQISADAEAESRQLRQRTQGEIDAAKERAIAELYGETAALATQVAGQILRREIRVEDQQALVAESLSKLTEGRNN